MCADLCLMAALFAVLAFGCLFRCENPCLLLSRRTTRITTKQKTGGLEQDQGGVSGKQNRTKDQARAKTGTGLVEGGYL